MTEEERMSILRRYIRNPLSDDSDLYYNGISGSSFDLSNKIHVACSVLSDWKKQKNESEKRTIEKRPLVNFSDYVPKHKRNTRTTPNPVFQNHKKDLRITFKLPENSVYSIKKSSDVTMTLPKKRSRTKAEKEDGSRAKKLTKIEPFQSPVEPTEKNINININNISSNLKARLQENNAVLVIRKNLTATDVAENNQRLSIPESQIRSPNFLTKEELMSLSYTQKPVPNLNAKLIEPSGDVCDIKLARWRMRTTMVFNIFGSWKNVVTRNNLRENMPIEIYSFREGSDLYFAVIRV